MRGALLRDSFRGESMRVRRQAWLAAFMVLAAAAARAEDAAPVIITNPDWLKRPTAALLQANWPTKALKEGVSGRATIGCVVTAQGTLRSCTVVDEAPAGYGFGQSALLLAPTFLMKPQLRNGAPVDGGQVRFPIRFGDGHMQPIKNADKNDAIMPSKVIWAEAPSRSEWMAAYPLKPGKGLAGQVVLKCAFRPTGALGECGTVIAEPDSAKMVKAARGLMPRFRMAVETLDGLDVAKLRINLPIHFMDPEGPVDRVLLQPEWIRTVSADKLQQVFPPKAADAGLTTGRAILDCVADAQGMMTACKVLKEEPEAMDFGAAAQRAAAVMGVNPWTEDGFPAEGSHVKFAVRLNSNESPPKP